MKRNFFFNRSDFEKRIFLLYFFYTFTVVLILLLFSWILAKYGINQYENNEIRKELTHFSIQLDNKLLDLQNSLNELIGRPEIISASSRKNKLIIEEAVQQNELGSLVIFDRERNIWFGENWELMQKYLPQIYQSASQTFSGSFLGSFNEKMYIISFSPCISDSPNPELISIFVVSQLLGIQDFKYDTFRNQSLITYQNLSKPHLRELESHKEKIVKIVDSLDPRQEDRIITKLNNNYCLAIRCFFDLKKNPTGVFLMLYQRQVNSFAQQSIILFLLVLLAATLLIVGFLGNWFSKSILAPVKEVSGKMNEITQNPAVFQKLENKYDGVLGEMAYSFNIMNDALANHSKTLRDYKLLTDNIETGIFWLDKELNILLCNNGFQHIIEIGDISQIMGRNICQLLGLKEELQEVLNKGSITIPALEITIKSKKFVILNIKYDKYENSVRFFGSITDITKEVNAITAVEALEIELIKSNKLAEIGSKIEGIVHNLNSPLNSILGYAQLAKKAIPDSEDIDKIIDAGRNAARMVKGLLDKVKQSNTGMIRPVDINDVLEQEISLCEHNLFFKHYVILQKDLQVDLPKITVIYGDISLCIANLLNNAFDAMQNSIDKNLRLATYAKDGFINIEIEDSGHGIPAKEFEKIFKAYYSTKSNKPGSGYGLGLAISKNIVNKYNGDILVKSEVDKGTTFTIRLPYENQQMEG